MATYIIEIKRLALANKSITFIRNKGFNIVLFFFFFSVWCTLVIFVVSSGRWTAPSDVSRWLFHGVFFLGNFLLARCFLFLFCGEGMTTGHVLWFNCASSLQGQRSKYYILIFIFGFITAVFWVNNRRDYCMFFCDVICSDIKGLRMRTGEVLGMEKRSVFINASLYIYI